MLSFALTENGLVAGKADWKPKDGRVTLGEWLAYAVDAVPKLTSAGPGRGVLVHAVRASQIPAVFDFALQDEFVIQSANKPPVKFLPPPPDCFQ